MIVQIKNNRQIILERLMPEDYDNLSAYLQHLSPDSKKRFGPHGYDIESILGCYENPDHSGYIARDAETLNIIAYSIIKTGYLEHDSSRLRSYGLTLNKLTDCTFAPSVADEWQSLGVGNCLFRFVLSDLKSAAKHGLLPLDSMQSRHSIKGITVQRIFRRA